MINLTRNSTHKVPGIYGIICLINYKIYVGSSTDLYKRTCLHKRKLERNIHKNNYLQNAFNKYGKDNFKIIVLESFSSITVKNLRIKEQSWMDYFNSYDRRKGFNLKDIALDGTHLVITKAMRKSGYLLGKNKIWSKEDREKVSKRHKGKKYSQETKLKMSEAQKGRKVSKETKIKLSKAKTGVKRNIEDLSHLRKPILQFDKQGNFIKEYIGVNEACRLGRFDSKSLVSVCKKKKKFKSHKGFIFRYKSECPNYILDDLTLIQKK
jgi:group I intron endonuclease